MTEPNRLQLAVTSSDDLCDVFVTVAGEIDTTNAKQLIAVVTVCGGWLETRCVMVDLSGAGPLDSSGIGALLTCDEELRAVRVDFAVGGARDGVVRVLEQSGVAVLRSQPTSAWIRRPAPRAQGRTLDRVAERAQRNLHSVGGPAENRRGS